MSCPRNFQNELFKRVNDLETSCRNSCVTLKSTPLLTLFGGGDVGQQHGVPMRHLRSTFQPASAQGFGQPLWGIQGHQLLGMLKP